MLAKDKRLNLESREPNLALKDVIDGANSKNPQINIVFRQEQAMTPFPLRCARKDFENQDNPGSAILTCNPSIFKYTTTIMITG